MNMHVQKYSLEEFTFLTDVQDHITGLADKHSERLERKIKKLGVILDKRVDNVTATRFKINRLIKKIR